MQYLAFEVILPSQHRDFRKIVGPVCNEHLVKAFLYLLALWGFKGDDPFLLVLVAGHSGDFGLQTKMIIELEMLCVILQVFLHLGCGRM